jgi:hypothetical protein
MRALARVAGGLLVAVCVATAWCSEAAPTPAPRARVASADEYFGQLKMSVLGIRNKVKDLGLDADVHPDRAQAVLGSALQVEDALRGWASKYPRDTWLPRYLYALETMYEHIAGDEAHARAIRHAKYIVTFFPNTVYARICRAKLDVGVPTPGPPATIGTPDSARQRLALIDGKAAPTMPPLVRLVPLNPLPAAAVGTPAPTPTPAP